MKGGGKLWWDGHMTSSVVAIIELQPREQGVVLGGQTALLVHRLHKIRRRRGMLWTGSSESSAGRCDRALPSARGVGRAGRYRKDIADDINPYIRGITPFFLLLLAITR